jgi:hypothetical protein
MNSGGAPPGEYFVLPLPILAINGRIACSADGADCAQALPANSPTQIIATTTRIFFMCLVLDFRFQGLREAAYAATSTFSKSTH